MQLKNARKLQFTNDTRFVDFMKSGTSRTERIAIEKADALFQIRRIGEIQVIEKATFEQIEAKRRELKELVGASYKDVLVSADAILEMSQHSNDILNNLCRIQNQLKSSSSIKSHGSKRNATDERLHAMASRVKCLLDVQEMVWNALDAGDYLEAARRYQRGELVMDQLMNHVKTAVLKRFPFVEHLWPTLLQLKPQILDQVRSAAFKRVKNEVLGSKAFDRERRSRKERCQDLFVGGVFVGNDVDGGIAGNVSSVQQTERFEPFYQFFVDRAFENAVSNWKTGSKHDDSYSPSLSTT